MAVPGWPNAYAIGVGQRSLTVLSQQTRATNLAWALSPRIPDRPHVVVVGAGCAGLIFAATARLLGFDDVTLVEAADHRLSLFSTERNLERFESSPYWRDADTHAGLAPGVSSRSYLSGTGDGGNTAQRGTPPHSSSAIWTSTPPSSMAGSAPR